MFYFILIETFLNIINIFTVTFDQLNASSEKNMFLNIFIKSNIYYL